MPDASGSASRPSWLEQATWAGPSLSRATYKIPLNTLKDLAGMTLAPRPWCGGAPEEELVDEKGGRRLVLRKILGQRQRVADAGDETAPGSHRAAAHGSVRDHERVPPAVVFLMLRPAILPSFLKPAVLPRLSSRPLHP